MFENLSERLGGVFDRLTKAGALTADDVTAALREVRVALLEADVSLPVARDFIKRVQGKATGAAVTKSITPGQQVVKIVHDELIATLRGDEDPGKLKIDNPPAPVLMVGLQGSGKTTTTAKLARRLKEREGKRVLMASLDTNRPAAMEQLAILGGQIGVDTLPIVKGETAVQIARRAKSQATLGGYDVYLLDTAGRLHIDEVLMDEVQAVRDAVSPRETLLVVDGLTGQDAVNVATEFEGKVGITGVVLTRMDGDGRGGAALSMRAVTGKPIKLIGTGEKMDALEDFHPARIADRILGMGDIVSLVEKAAETVSAEDAAKMAKKVKKGQFDLEDLKNQLLQMKKMGGMNALMGLMPGMGQIKKAMQNANVDEKIFDRQVAIINSMTAKERANPNLLNASRRKRIANGSGMQVSDVNKLMKQHQQMAGMMKRVAKGGGLGALSGMLGGRGGPMGGGLGGGLGKMLGGGGMPDLSNMDPKELEQMAKQMGIDPKSLPSPTGESDDGALPADFSQLTKKAGGPGAIPGLGGKPQFPGLPGLGSGPIRKK